MGKKLLPKIEPHNYYEHISKDLIPTYYNPGKHLHGLDIPFRVIITGHTGSGKTSTLFHLLRCCGDSFDKLIICCMMPNEPLYEQLRRSSDPETVEFHTPDKPIPKIEDYDDRKQSICIIYDDLVTLKKKEHKPIEDAFIAGRKGCRGGGISVIYLSQVYYGIPKVIRDQADCAIFKKVLNSSELKQIFRGTSLQDLRRIMQMYNDCTQNKSDFFTVWLNKDENHRFAKNFIEFYPPPF